MMIPKSFKLHVRGAVWTVSRFISYHKRALGCCRPEIRQLHVAHGYTTTWTNDKTIPGKFDWNGEGIAADTFWHELTHAILHDMGDPRWNDEKFVEAFSKRLSCAVRTAKL